MNRGVTVMDSFQYFRPDYEAKDMKLAAVLGYCIEFVTFSHQIVAIVLSGCR